MEEPKKIKLENPDDYVGEWIYPEQEDYKLTTYFYD